MIKANLSSNLGFGKDERLQFSLKVSDCKLDTCLARIEGDLKLRPLPNVTDSNNIPCRFGWFLRAKGANKGKLLG